MTITHPLDPARLDKLTQAAAEISEECAAAMEMHPPFCSTHHGYAVILEELDEAWDEIKRDDLDRALEEMVQVGAMALRFIVEMRAEERPAVNRLPTQAEVAAWLDQHIKRTTEEQALVLAEETGEVCRAVVKRSQGLRGTHVEWTARIQAEVADAHLTLLAIAATEGFDLAAATARKWAKITGRDANASRPPNEDE